MIGRSLNVGVAISTILSEDQHEKLQPPADASAPGVHPEMTLSGVVIEQVGCAVDPDA
jgi:hypothetical protein